MKRFSALALTLFLALGACSSSVPGEDLAGDEAAIPSPAPEGLEEFYNQDIEWGACEDSGTINSECTTITVPLDYDNPDGETIEIAVLKAKATEEAKGSLFVNPGGPGASGQDVAATASFYFTEELRANYDIIGFDPRGVGDSAPVDCLPDDELGIMLDKSYEDTDEGEAEAIADTKDIVAACEETSGELLEFVSTIDAAKDMDVMRAALGEAKLDYFGFSYGTHLGGQYADLFPENVGHMVLDGAVDPAISSLDQSYFQAVGFEQALDAYIEYCLAEEDCPLEGDSPEEAKAYLQELITSTADEPIETAIEDRVVNPGIFYTGIATTLYAEETWPYLTQALDMVVNQDDGTLILTFNDLMIGRDTYSGAFSDNSLEARWAINCIDYPADIDEEAIAESDARLHEDAPTFAPYFEGGDTFCGEWPYTADEVPGPFIAEGSNDILVIGTDGDPATPYQSSVNLAEQLDNGVLLTWEGEGHTAYGTAGPCIEDAVDNYFINDEVPEDGLTCPAE